MKTYRDWWALGKAFVRPSFKFVAFAIGIAAFAYLRGSYPAVGLGGLVMAAAGLGLAQWLRSRHGGDPGLPRDDDEAGLRHAGGSDYYAVGSGGDYLGPVHGDPGRGDVAAGAGGDVGGGGDGAGGGV
jgi:hypothetical protein